MTATDIPGIALLRASVRDLPFIMATERGPDFERFAGRWSEGEHCAALASLDYAYLLGKPANGTPKGFTIVRDINDAHGNVCLKRIAVMSDRKHEPTELKTWHIRCVFWG